MYLKLYKAISCILCLGRDIYYAKYYGGGEHELGTMLQNIESNTEVPF